MTATADAAVALPFHSKLQRSMLSESLIGGPMKGLYLAAAVAAFAAPVAAQAPVVDTGMVAPNFTAPGAMQSGVLPAVSLSAYKGKTVVLAFFFKARTKG